MTAVAGRCQRGCRLRTPGQPAVRAVASPAVRLLSPFRRALGGTFTDDTSRTGPETENHQFLFTFSTCHLEMILDF